MEIEKYINKKKELYDILLKFIENGNDNNDTDYQNLIKNIDDQKILENGKELKEFLHIVLKISKNHHRYSDFFSKIERILIYCKDSIKQTFSNLEIFNFFKSHKLILFFLLKNEVLFFDQLITNIIIEKVDSDPFFSFYFFPEIKDFVDEDTRHRIESKIIKMDSNIFDNFDKKRQLGQNDSYLANLIREDSINEFISYVKEQNLSISSTIKHSIFETNLFLLKNKEPTLIEYAAFFRSIQIIQYLRKSDVELTPSLWLYSIHGRNTQLIQLLKENKIEPEDKTYKRCLEESIKCHHNDITNSILDNFLNKDEELKFNDNNFDDNVVAYCFHYYNFSYMPQNFINRIVFCYLCKYDYYTFVDLFLQVQNKLLYSTIISTKKYFLNQIPKSLFFLNQISFNYKSNSKLIFLFNNDIF